MRPYTVKIAAGTEEEIYAPGDYVRIHSATQAITVEAPDNGEEVELLQGDDARLSPFQRLRLSHAGAGELTITLYIGNGTQAGSARVGGSLAIEQGGALSLADPVKSVGTAAGKVVDASTSRKALHWRNTGTTTIYLGPSTVTAALGVLELAPGDEWREAEGAAAEWWAISDAAGGTLAQMEIA